VFLCYCFYTLLGEWGGLSSLIPVEWGLSLLRISRRVLVMESGFGGALDLSLKS